MKARGDRGIAGVGEDGASELCVGIEIWGDRGWMDDGQVRGGVHEGSVTTVRPPHLAARGAGGIGLFEVGLRQ